MGFNKICSTTAPVEDILLMKMYEIVVFYRKGTQDRSSKSQDVRQRK